MIKMRNAIGRNRITSLWIIFKYFYHLTLIAWTASAASYQGPTIANNLANPAARPSVCQSNALVFKFLLLPRFSFNQNSTYLSLRIHYIYHCLFLKRCNLELTERENSYSLLYCLLRRQLSHVTLPDLIKSSCYGRRLFQSALTSCYK